MTHRNVTANVDALNGPAGLGTTGEDVGVSWLPLNHDMGLVGMALGPLYSRRPAVLLTPQMFVKRPVEWLKAMQQNLFDKAKKFRDENTHQVDSYDDFKKRIEGGGFFLAHWDGTRTTGDLRPTTGLLP